jgi:hypothetical protein
LSAKLEYSNGFTIWPLRNIYISFLQYSSCWLKSSNSAFILLRRLSTLFIISLFMRISLSAIVMSSLVPSSSSLAPSNQWSLELKKCELQGWREPTTGPGTKWRLVNTSPLTPCPSRLSRWLFLIAINVRELPANYLQKSPHNW